MSGMSGFGVVCLYSENRAKAPAGGKGRRGMAGQGKSGEKKTMRDILSAFLRMPAPESALEERALLLAQARGAPLDLYEAVVLTQIAKAMKGDTSAAALVRDSAGENPSEKAAAVPEAALSENDLALLRKLDAAGVLEALAGMPPGPAEPQAGKRRARPARGPRGAKGGAPCAQKAQGGAAARKGGVEEAEIFLAEKSPNG